MFWVFVDCRYIEIFVLVLLVTRTCKDIYQVLIIIKSDIAIPTYHCCFPRLHICPFTAWM